MFDWSPQLGAIIQVRLDQDLPESDHKAGFSGGEGLENTSSLLVCFLDGLVPLVIKGGPVIHKDSQIFYHFGWRKWH